MASMTGVVPRVGRKLRTPNHPFQVYSTPFAIQPFFIAPVLAGETMKNLLFQARVVTDPIKNGLVGWWIEYYFFYVKLTDLDERDTIMAALVDPTASMSSLNTGASQRHYHAAGGPGWSEKCLKRVVEEYFRDEADAWNHKTLDGLPAAQVNGEDWMNSLTKSSEVDTNDFNVDLNANSTITASEVERAWMQWQMLKSGNLIDMSYEDYLRSFGVNLPQTANRRPELIRYVREWSYPSNTVNPSTGLASAAVSWGLQERADKDRFFREPGFLYGVTVARPKVYRVNQVGSAVDLMETAYAWLPAAMRSQPGASLLRVTGTNSPLSSFTTTEYVVDINDLLLYGDQFVNFDLGAVLEDNSVTLPVNGSPINTRYVDQTSVDSLFVDGSKNRVRMDGIVRLNILGAQEETSPRGSPGSVIL